MEGNPQFASNEALRFLHKRLDTLGSSYGRVIGIKQNTFRTTVAVSTSSTCSMMCGIYKTGHDLRVSSTCRTPAIHERLPVSYKTLQNIIGASLSTCLILHFLLGIPDRCRLSSWYCIASIFRCRLERCFCETILVLDKCPLTFTHSEICS